MLIRFKKAADFFSSIVFRLAEVSVVILVFSMVYEVFARYFMNAPTEWAFDIAYMCSGALFILGVAWTLKQDAHIRISVLRQKFPKKINALIDVIFYGLILTPTFAMLFWVSSERTWIAFIRNKVDNVSPWAPKMWPFYSIISIGLAALTLQLIAETLHAAWGAAEEKPNPEEK